jgi:hypothetical protein
MKVLSLTSSFLRQLIIILPFSSGCVTRDSTAFLQLPTSPTVEPFSKTFQFIKSISANYFPFILSRVFVATIIRRVLDWQLDLLDHTQLQCIHFTTHYCSCNSSLKNAARPEYSLVTGTVHVTNSYLTQLWVSLKTPAPPAATNSYGIPCHH